MRNFPASILQCMFVCAALLHCKTSFSQEKDTLSIEEVALTFKKSRFSAIGKKSEVIDSAMRELFRFGTAADLLAFSSAIYVKSYGPGGIATTAMRGGNAEQAAVLWNGMNLQNTMLGQTDLSTLPAILFESVGIEYGSSASLWGSGAVGGSILLGNRSRFGKQFKVSTSGSFGNEGQRNASSVIVAGSRKIVNTAKIYVAGSKNNFRFVHPSSGAVETMSMAPFSGTGFMNEFRYAPWRGHVFAVNVWLNQANRDIPSYHQSVPSRQSQHDLGARFQASWNFQRNRYRTQLRSAYFSERIDFNDSTLMLFAKNVANTTMLDNEHFYSWGKGHEVHAGIYYLDTRASSGNYEGQQGLRRYSVLAGNKFVFLNERLEVGINGRAEYFSAATLPLTGNLGVEYRFMKSLKAGFNVSTFYRQPTLNELYWTPGGNPRLRPEEGESADGIITFHKEKRKLRFTVSAAAFTRKVRNWILWVPGAGGNPSPLNMQQVWSRGGETSWRLDFVSGDWRAGAKANTSYVLSTVVKSEIPNSATVGKQLVYTPLYTANGSLSGGYRKTSVYLLAQYAGYRFISTDNSSWLDPYTVISVRVTQQLAAGGLGFVLFAAANNLLNEDYLIQAGRPMPLRSFEFGFTIHITPKIKHEDK